jgi:hypothetical protein
MQFRNEYWRFESYSSQALARLQVPENRFPVLRCAEKKAVICGPAQGLHLAKVTLQFPCNSIRFNIKHNDGAIELLGLYKRQQVG